MSARPTALYDPETPVAQLGRERDLAWFVAHPRETWRVRPALEGEAAFIDGMRSVNPASRGYMVSIHHARARDRRAAVKLGTYPVIVRLADREQARGLLLAEGERLARWFKKHAWTPPASQGTAMLAEVAL